MACNIGRFGPKPAELSEITLQEPLSKIVDSGLCDLRISQYYFDEPIFDEYELTTVRATWDFAPAESLVQPGSSVLDLGCGDGRLMLHLAESCKLGESYGIDISGVAIDRFKTGIRSEDTSRIHARRGDIFDLPSDVAEKRFDVVTFGDATINFILEEEKLQRMFTVAREQLKSSKSRVMVAVFGDGTPEKIAWMDKRVTVVPFRRPNGQAALIWWAYKFNAEKLIMHRSAFAQTGWNDNGAIEGIVSDLRDRMWTPSSIIPIAARCGLVEEQTIISKVQDGTAVGMDTAIVILKPDR